MGKVWTITTSNSINNAIGLTLLVVIEKTAYWMQVNAIAKNDNTQADMENLFVG